MTNELFFAPNIPAEWRLIPNKYLFISHSKKVGKGFNDYQLLSLTKKGVIAKDINSNEGKLPASFEGYQTVSKNDMIFCLFDLDMSAVFSGLSNLSGMITSAYDVFSLNYNFIDSNYCKYWFDYVFTGRYYKNYSKNIRYTVSEEAFGQIKTPIPSLDEQIKIGAILDKKINQIDELISNQEKQIEKLEEYKQSIITKAVTKGLDPNAKMKDSGVESIGLYPAHWKLMRAKFIAASIAKGSGITKEDVLESGNIDCVRYGEIYSKYSISFSKALSKTNIELIKDAQHIGYGDILCSGTGELVEEIGKNVVYLGHDDCLAGGDIIIVKHSQEPRFLNYALYCTASQLQKSKGKAKLKVVHISASNIGNINLVLPDSKEQKEIADYLDAKCNFVNSLIEIQKNKIEHLKEYKKSLIYEYVTGKKRVA